MPITASATRRTMRAFQFGSRGSGRGVVAGSSIQENHILSEEYDWPVPGGSAGVDQGRREAPSGACGVDIPTRDRPTHGRAQASISGPSLVASTF
jgi:hypothetical protein